MHFSQTQIHVCVIENWYQLAYMNVNGTAISDSVSQGSARTSHKRCYESNGLVVLRVGCSHVHGEFVWSLSDQ